MRIAPPLTVSEAEVDLGVELLGEAVGRVTGAGSVSRSSQSFEKGDGDAGSETRCGLAALRALGAMASIASVSESR
jgi:hypothetical protein